MTFGLTIPLTIGTPLETTISVGESLFILGANGTGKSSLMQRFYSNHSTMALWISAHRQTWFASNEITLSPHQKQQTETNMRHNDIQPQSRWMDQYSAPRANIAICDLIDAQNVRARSIAGEVDRGNFDLAKKLSKKDAPIKAINELLRFSNLPIEIFIESNDHVIARKSGGTPYSVAELSDGERNALLIAASILTAKDGALILIDEPERHLHRSIISPLLTLLFATRKECAFIVSTHDIMLSLDNPEARMLLVRGCTYSNSAVTTWEADLVPSETAVDDELRKDILGARKRILFVEGTEQSLDKPLYSLIFPDVSVIAKSSCRDVEHAVSGIRDADDLHWLHAWGIVDNDRRTNSDIANLKEKGIYAVSVFSVESIYYHPEIQQRVTERHVSVTGEDASTRLRHAKDAALTAIRPHAQRLSERAVEKTLREQIFSYFPTSKEIAAATPIDISIDVAKILNQERTRIEGALNADDLESIIMLYPIRETPALNAIAKKLGFEDRKQYEGAVRKLILDDDKTLTFVKTFFNGLATDIIIV